MPQAMASPATLAAHCQPGGITSRVCGWKAAQANQNVSRCTIASGWMPVNGALTARPTTSRRPTGPPASTSSAPLALAMTGAAHLSRAVSPTLHLAEEIRGLVAQVALT